MLKKTAYYLNYWWRVIATGISFVFFGLGSLVLGYIIFPIIQCVTWNKDKRKYRAQYAIHLAFKLFVFALKVFGLTDFSFRGFAKLRKDKGCVFVSNHPTLIDYVVIVSRLPRCDIIVKKALWNNLFIKQILKTAGYIPNLSSAATFELVKKSLEAGNNVLIFPEGTRSVPGRPLVLKRGAAQIVVRTRAPLRVVKLDCSYSMLTKGRKWYQVAERKPLFVLTVGRRIDSSSYLQYTAAPSVAARHLTRDLKKILEKGE